MYSNNTKTSLNDAVQANKMKVFDAKFMKDETNATLGGVSYVGAGIFRRNVTLPSGNTSSGSAIFGLRGLRNEMTATTVCRTFPVVPTGIQTLNLMLDPIKSSDRENKVEVAKKKYHKNFGQMDITKSYEKLFELLWYTRLPCFDVKGVTSKEKDEMSVIKRCYWRGQLVDCASIFVTRPTDRGMCCTFNIERAEKSFKDTKYGNVTSQMQAQDKIKSFGGIAIG